MDKLELELPAERIYGFTIPENDKFFICCTDEVFEVAVAELASLKSLDDDPFQFFKTAKSFLGLRQGKAIHSIHEHRLSYDFCSSQNHVDVKYRQLGSEHLIRFPTLSGDWFECSFSPCAKYLILAEPYNLWLYRIYSKPN